MVFIAILMAITLFCENLGQVFRVYGNVDVVRLFHSDLKTLSKMENLEKSRES